MWDLRQQTSVGVLGMPSMNYNIEAHSDMVTCLDAVDHMLLSGSVDATMCAWDLRMVSQSPTGCGPLHQFNVSVVLVCECRSGVTWQCEEPAVSCVLSDANHGNAANSDVGCKVPISCTV